MNISPIGFDTLPKATKWLLVCCAAGYVIHIFAGHITDPVLGLVPARITENFWLWQMCTYMFIHGSFFHFLFNSLMIWVFGRMFETEWGSVRFLLYFLATGLGAALMSVLISPHSSVPVIGASGSVYGLLTALAVIFPNATVYLYFLFPVKAVQMAVILAAIEFVSGISGARPGIATFAHLGGMLTGLIWLKGIPYFAGKWESFSQRPGQDVSFEVDRILEKINSKGVYSISSGEKKLLDEYGRSAKR